MKFDEADKTDWFPGTVAPAYEGVYERRYLTFASDRAAEINRVCAFSKFALPNPSAPCEYWFAGMQTPDTAATVTCVSTFGVGHRDFEWRGLKVDPNTVVIKPEVHAVAHNVPGLALDSGEFIPAEALNQAHVPPQIAEEDLF